MQVGVARSEAGQQTWLTIVVSGESTVRQVIDRSGILESFPGIDRQAQKVGTFGRLVKLEMGLRPEDRVEICRAITGDPQTVPRRDGEGDDDEEPAGLSRLREEIPQPGEPSFVLTDAASRSRRSAAAIIRPALPGNRPCPICSPTSIHPSSPPSRYRHSTR